VYASGAGGRLLAKKVWEEGIKKKMPQHYKVNKKTSDYFSLPRLTGDFVGPTTLVIMNFRSTLSTLTYENARRRYEFNLINLRLARLSKLTFLSTIKLS
jgi:hypothetical protein